MKSGLQLAGLLLALAVAGCGGSVAKPTLYSVTGKVAIGGEAKQGVTVSLSPVAGGEPASGVTAVDGSFIIVTPGVGEGAIPGTHKVTLTAALATNEVDMNAAYSGTKGGDPYKAQADKAKLPPDYSSVDKTPLSFKVEPIDSNVLNVEI